MLLWWLAGRRVPLSSLSCATVAVAWSVLALEAASHDSLGRAGPYALLALFAARDAGWRARGERAVERIVRARRGQP